MGQGDDVGFDELSLHAATAAVDLLAVPGRHQELEVARMLLGHSQYYAGRFHDAAETFGMVLESARARDHRQHMSWGLYTCARSALALGNLDVALRETLESNLE